jgi:hypothetical protein
MRDMNCREVIREIFETEKGVLDTSQVVTRVYAKYPARPWKENTISAYLIGLSVNHPSSRHYLSTRQHACLFSLGRGRYRQYNPDTDGTWAVTETGVELLDDDEASVDEESEDPVSAVSTSVSLERDLERCLLADLAQLQPGLRLYQEGGVDGYQYSTNAVGRIDILAIDAQRDYIVIELKAGQADETVCGQILRYMGWVKREIAKERTVKGVIVAHSFHESVRYAVEAMPNVTLMRYEVQFRFMRPEP